MCTPLGKYIVGSFFWSNPFLFSAQTWCGGVGEELKEGGGWTDFTKGNNLKLSNHPNLRVRSVVKTFARYPELTDDKLKYTVY